MMKRAARASDRGHESPHGQKQLDHSGLAPQPLDVQIPGAAHSQNTVSSSMVCVGWIGRRAVPGRRLRCGDEPKRAL